MSTVPCPGCGMPRAAELIDRSPCPVCGSTTTATLEPEPEPVQRSSVGPAYDLPADAAELERWTGAKSSRFGSGLVVGVLLGTLVGVGASYVWQRGLSLPAVAESVPGGDSVEADAAPRAALSPVNPPPVDVAPPSSVPTPSVPANRGEPPVTPSPPSPAPGQPLVIEVNEPDGTYTLPFATQNHEQIVLKGKAKSFRLPRVSGGATVDASALDAREIRVGRIDGGARVKLNAPEGIVTVAGPLEGQAALEIDAPGGEVTFPAPNPSGPIIDGGANLSITAKRVAIRGDVRGAATHVRITLTRAGSLHVGAVQGTAVVEYRSATSGWSYSTVTVGPVAPSATVRELGPKPDAVVDDR